MAMSLKQCDWYFDVVALIFEAEVVNGANACALAELKLAIT